VDKKLKYKSLTEVELLALLSASSVLRKTNYFKVILRQLVNNKTSSKKIYEALLQTYLFVGFPSALSSLKLFKEIVVKKKIYKGFDLNKYLDRGKRNCKLIYADKYDKLLNNVKSYSPEMAEWLIIEGYGKVLGRKGLTLREREICIVSILSAMKFKDQLYSHIIGSINIKVNKKLLLSSIRNLSLINAKSSAKFGESCLNEYLHRRMKLVILPQKSPIV
jgi:alkylhydroperoxidase/carboxymuconolactone decarboxylase family protein YurZ